MADAKIGLTIHLLKPDKVASFDDALKKGRHDIRPLAAPLDGEFISLPSQPGEPPWVEAIRSVLEDRNRLTLDSQSPAGLLVVRRSGNTFVLSFGHAWQKLQPQWVEPDFGLRVALNAIPRNKLIEIRAEQIFARRHIASERAPRASFIEEFGVDFDRDFLGALEGIPTNKDLGSHVRGGTNLRLQLPISRLVGTLDRAIRLFHSASYKQRWPEVGNVNPVRDASTIAGLESQLDAELASGQALRRLVLFTPAERRDEESQIAYSYVFGHMMGKPVYRPYLLIESWINFLKGKKLAPTVAEAKTNRVHLLDEAKEDFSDYSVFDCFGYELIFGGRPYVLSSGTWYEVVSDFVAHINKYITGIKGPAVALPAWNQGNQVEHEPAYNKRCGGAPGFLHFDSADVLFGGGQSKFEFCDFLHVNSKTLYFVKIASKSNGMSHLVEQVRRTAELLFSTDGTYREELTKVFKKYHPTADTSWLKSRPDNGDWKLCMVSLGNGILVIQSKTSGKLNTIRMRIPMTRLRRVQLPYPSPKEQVAIVRFLNWANGRLERAVRAKLKVIALLNEQKQVIIHRAVTCGLAPSVPLKPSGVPWLADIPQHWEVRPLKQLLARMDYGTSENVRGEGRVRVLTMGHIRDGKVVLPSKGGLRAVPPGLLLLKYDLLFNRTNSPELVGKVGLFTGDGDDEVTFASYLVRLRVRSEHNPIWLNYLLNSTAFWRYARSQALVSLHQANLNSKRYGQIVLPVPSTRVEQDKIVEHIRSEVGGIELAVNRLERENELLREYRTRLVADVVTGKLDVREAAAQLPEEAAPHTAEDEADLSIDPETADEDAVV